MTRVPLLFIAPRLDVGGAERLWADLVPRLPDAGFSPRILCLSGLGAVGEQLAGAGVPVTALPDGASPWQMLRSGLEQARRRPELILTIGVNAAVLGSLIARARGGLHVLNWHDPPDLPMTQRQRRALRLCARLGSRALAVSDTQRSTLGDLGFQDDDITVVFNGVRRVAPVLDAAALRADLGLPTGHRLVLGIGRLEPQKRFDRFIDVIAMLGRDGETVCGVIAGEGSLRTMLAERAAAAGGAVRLIGARTDMASLYAAADVLCMTSDQEAQPLVILEAFSHALPVVAPSVGGIPEMIVDGENGILVADQDLDAYVAGVRRCLDPNARRMLGEAASRRYERSFSHERMIGAYIDYFRASVAR